MDIYEQLRRDEGVRLFPYMDTAGKLTIGVGRNLTNVGLSDAEAGVLLTNDVQRVTAQLNSHLPYFQLLDPVRQAVLVNMAFNMGFNGLEGFPKMLQAVAQGDWATAAAEMLDSAWAGQVGDRAKRLAQQMTSGEWV